MQDITQKELDTLLTDVFADTRKNQSYWKKTETKVSYVVRIPDESAIEQSSFYGYGGNFDKEETREKTVTTFTLKLDELLKHKGYSNKLILRNIIIPQSEIDTHIEIDDKNCQDKPLNQTTKLEIKDSILHGKHKVNTEKFSQLIKSNIIPDQEIKTFYIDLTKYSLDSYVDVIYNHNPSIDPQRTKREEKAMRALIEQKEKQAQESKKRKFDAEEKAKQKEQDAKRKKAEADRNKLEKQGQQFMDRFVKKK